MAPSGTAGIAGMASLEPTPREIKFASRTSKQTEMAMGMSKKKRNYECTDDFYAKVKCLQKAHFRFRDEQTPVNYEQMRLCLDTLVRSKMTLDIREKLDELVERFNFFQFDNGRFMVEMDNFFESTKKCIRYVGKCRRSDPQLCLDLELSSQSR